MGDGAADAGKSRRPKPRRIVLGAAAIGVAGVAGAAFLVLGWPQEDPDRIAARVQQEWRAGRLEQADAELAKLGRRRPLTTLERLMAGQIARQRGKPDAGLAALAPIPATDPMAADVLLARGLLAVDAFRVGEAVAALEDAVRVDPRRPEAHRELARLGALWKRPDLIDDHCRALVRADQPLDFDELALWILGKPQDRELSDDARLLERAVAADPGDRGSRLALAESLRRLGRLDDADAALAGLPDEATRAIRARIALDRGDLEAARPLLLGGPADASSLALLGRIDLARGDIEAATTRYRAAVAADPGSRDARAGLGQSLRLAGHDEEAARHQEIARRHDQLAWLVANAGTHQGRGDAATLRALGDACLALDDRDRARAWYRLAVSRNPLDSASQKALHDLGTSPRDGRRTP